MPEGKKREIKVRKKDKTITHTKRLPSPPIRIRGCENPRGNVLEQKNNGMNKASQKMGGVWVEVKEEI